MKGVTNPAYDIFVVAYSYDFKSITYTYCSDYQTAQNVATTELAQGGEAVIYQAAATGVVPKPTPVITPADPKDTASPITPLPAPPGINEVP